MKFKIIQWYVGSSSFTPLIYVNLCYSSKLFIQIVWYKSQNKNELAQKKLYVFFILFFMDSEHFQVKLGLREINIQITGEKNQAPKLQWLCTDLWKHDFYISSHQNCKSRNWW